MNKTELIEAMAARSQTSKAQTTVMLNGLLEIIQEAMANGNDVQLVGFGTYMDIWSCPILTDSFLLSRESLNL